MPTLQLIGIGNPNSLYTPFCSVLSWPSIQAILLRHPLRTPLRGLIDDGADDRQYVDTMTRAPGCHVVCHVVVLGSHDGRCWAELWMLVCDVMVARCSGRSRQVCLSVCSVRSLVLLIRWDGRRNDVVHWSLSAFLHRSLNRSRPSYPTLLSPPYNLQSATKHPLPDTHSFLHSPHQNSLYFRHSSGTHFVPRLSQYRFGLMRSALSPSVDQLFFGFALLTVIFSLFFVFLNFFLHAIN